MKLNAFRTRLFGASLVTCVIVMALAVASAQAGLPQLTTAKGNAIPTFSYQTNIPFTSRNGVVNVNGTFVNSYVYNPVARQYQWRVTGWTIGSDYSANQQTAIQNANVAAFPGLVAGAPPSIGLDCHGYSLKSDTAGVYGNNGPTILADQGYVAEAANATSPGDIVVYKKNGVITHTAVVNAVNPVNGAITSVTSRWGSQGVYTGGLNQMPAAYGPATLYYSAAAATVLTDPDSPVDLSGFAGLPEDFENTQGESQVNGFEGTSMALDSQNGSNWSYELDAPAEGIFLTSGDTLTLYSHGLTGASVSGSAAAYDWNISTGTDPTTGDSTATFTYEDATSDLLTNLDGFNITSSYTDEGDMDFEETFNGTIGLTVGPVVPEPSSLLLIGLCGALGLRRRRGR